MRQFDVYRNSSPVTRKAFPFLLILQHDSVIGTSFVVVAPLVPLQGNTTTSRLYPVLIVDGKPLSLLTPDLASLPRSALKRRVVSLERDRDTIIAAIDLLFAGS